MRKNNSRNGFMARAWLWCLGSLAVIGVLVFGLWDLGRPKQGGQKKPLILLCAAGIKPPIEQVRERYRKEFGIEIQIEPDGSGALLNKMRRAPEYGDLFLSAETSFMETARREKLVAEILPVAEQTPVIAVAPGNPLEIRSLADLLRDDVRVGLANPNLTAIGNATRRVMSKTDLWQKLEQRMSLRKPMVSLLGTVNEAAQAVTPKINAADVSILWDATAKQFKLDIVEVEEFKNYQDKIVIGVLSGSQQPHRALHFARYLTSKDKGAPVLQEFHLRSISDADEWEDEPQLHIMMGSMLQPALEPLLQQFEKREGVQITRQPNGCGILTSQMKGGARPSAYFSCDVKFMDQVQDLFEKPVMFSENDLVILVKKGNPKNITGLDDLSKEDILVGIGHPTLSALGAVTQRSLGDKLYTELYAKANKPVESPTGHELVQQIRFGPLDIALVYRSNALSDPQTLTDVELIETKKAGAFATQPFAIAKDSKHKYLLQRLQEAILSPESRQRFEKIGFRWLARPESP